MSAIQPSSRRGGHKPTRPPVQQAPEASPRPVSGVLGGLLVAIPVLVFALIWQYYAVNVPKWDDHALREYLYRSDQETTFWGKLYWLFRQHNEHRIVYDRLVAMLDYKLFGKMSYVHLMVAGNVSLVGLLAIFMAVLRRSGKSLIYAVPVALLLFNLSHWENMFWGMAALQNFSVVFWVFLAIYLLSFTDRWGLALSSAVLATLTSGNGLLIWPVGLLLLLLKTSNFLSPNGAKGIKRVPLLLGWGIAAATVIVLYFTGFEKPAGNPPDRGTIANLINGWVAFTGAAAEPLSTTAPLTASTRLGVLMLLITIACVGWSLRTYWPAIRTTVRSTFKPNTTAGLQKGLPSLILFFWGSAAFVLGTAAIVAWTRTGFGLDLIITSRYKIYSLTLLALLYVYAVSRLPRKVGRWTGVGSAIGSLLIAWLSYNAFLDDTIWWRHYLLTRQFNWTYGTSKPVAQLDDVTKKYTTPAPAFYDADPGVLYGPGQPAVWPIAVSQSPAGFVVQDGILTIQDKRDSRGFVVARSEKRTYLFPTRQNQNLAARTRFWPANAFTTGFSTTIAPIDLDAGTYRLFVLTVATDGQLTLYPTGRSIESAGQSAAPLQKNW